jgi:hypothetical protein
MLSSTGAARRSAHMTDARLRGEMNAHAALDRLIGH